jgi:uncharacterized Zn-finger protein
MIAYLQKYAYKAGMKSAAQTPFEVITVTTVEVYCDGGKGASGHPRVFLPIYRDTGQVVCPYCSRTYVLDPNAEAQSH